MALFDRVLILGGGGMLAHALRLVLADRAGTIVSPARAELDICDDASLARAFESAAPTLVLNCAAHTKVDLCDFQRDLAHAINGRAAGRAAALAAARGAAFVHYSTDFVFDGTSPRPYVETDPTCPRSEYGRSKLAGEHAVLSAHPGALVCRTSWLYGPGGPCFPATMVRVARSGKPLSVVSDQRGSPTFTLDLARLTRDLLEHTAPGGIYHTCNAGETNWFDFTAEILRVFGLSVPLSAITSAEWKARTPWSAERPARSTMDCSRAARAVGHPMRPWQEGLAEYRSLNAV